MARGCISPGGRMQDGLHAQYREINDSRPRRTARTALIVTPCHTAWPAVPARVWHVQLAAATAERLVGWISRGRAVA
jgi:hypothetical protein